MAEAADARDPKNCGRVASRWLSAVLEVALQGAGRKPVASQMRDLIFRMAAENPTWGAPRIHGELMKLGSKSRSPRSRAGFGGSRDHRILPSAG
jgi:hypothetical protein